MPGPSGFRLVLIYMVSISPVPRKVGYSVPFTLVNIKSADGAATLRIVF
jgi:hypothetical protein